MIALQPKILGTYVRMTDCLPGEARITGRARAIDVTPEDGKGPKVE